MANKIRIDLPEESFFVEIEGETPTVKENLRLARLIDEKRRGASGRRALPEADRKAEQMFDTQSGIQDFGLRAALSAAETPADEEAQLRKLYGMTETDFVRDKRGRLAITPSGGEKLGIELSRPTLIDESGFSRYDFADLAGIAPEVGGAIVGGIKGAALGTAVSPVLGTIIGGALGAGAGAASGQAIEEGIEALAGVQTQTAEEVAKDVGKEFAIGFLTDATLGAFGAGVRAAKGTLTAGKGLTEEELKVAAESIEAGVLPTLTAIRAPSIISRQQGIIEKIFGTSPRLKQNNDIMQKKLADWRSGLEKVGDDEAGRLLLERTGAQADELAKQQVDLQKAILENARTMAEDLGAAAEKNMTLDEDVFNILVGARQAFDEEVKRAFKPVDNALDSAFGSEKFIQIGNIREAAQAVKELEASALAGGTMKELDGALRSISAMGKQGPVSFTQLYNARKALNDLLSKVPYGNKTQRKHINDLMRKIDAKLSTNNLKATIESMGDAVPPDAANILIKASETLEPARNMYSEGAKIFEDIESAGVIKNLASKAARNETMGVADVAMDKVIVNNKPRILQRTLKAVEYGVAKGAKKSTSEQFRRDLAGQWMNDALTTSGLSRIDDFDPTKFKPAAFAKAVKDLGKTADVLFGDQVGEIRKLASQLEKTAVSNLKQADVEQIIKGLPENAPIVEKLNLLVDTQRAIHENQRVAALRKLQSGKLADAPVEAAELIANSSTSASDIKKIMNVFEGDPQALKKIQGNYMERLIADFGDTITTDGKTLGAFAKRLQEANQGGKLSAIFGDEMGKDMAKFADILAFNSRTAAGGDLVAANIAASPLQNLSKLLKYRILGSFLTSAPYYKQIVAQYKKLAAGETAESKARILGRLMSQAFTRGVAQTATQETQEGAREAERQVTSLISSSGLGDRISQLSSQIQTPNNYAAQVPTAPVAPVQAPSNLRQQAAQNPGIAAALGIQGPTAGLLNR